MSRSGGQHRVGCESPLEQPLCESESQGPVGEKGTTLLAAYGGLRSQKMLMMPPVLSIEKALGALRFAKT